MLLTLAQGLHALTKNSIKTKGWASSLDSNNLVQPESDVLFFDVYETTRVCLKGLDWERQSCFSRMSLTLLTLKTKAIFIAQNLNTLFPIKR